MFDVGPRQIKTALISVSDKTGIEPFAKRLSMAGIRLLSTGGTARLFA
jgi:phosphoribosylaminoimidazolecarboxamide formyltransferase/IMP cyclohydrolase